MEIQALGILVLTENFTDAMDCCRCETFAIRFEKFTNTNI